jgi:hypothetical protein
VEGTQLACIFADGTSCLNVKRLGRRFAWRFNLGRSFDEFCANFAGPIIMDDEYFAILMHNCRDQVLFGRVSCNAVCKLPECQPVVSFSDKDLKHSSDDAVRIERHL